MEIPTSGKRRDSSIACHNWELYIQSFAFSGHSALPQVYFEVIM